MDKSIYAKIKNALKLAKAAEVGCGFDRFEVIELLGYIQALEETVGLQRAEFDAQASEIERLKAENAALKEAQRNSDLVIADLEGQIERLQGGGWEESGV